MPAHVKEPFAAFGNHFAGHCHEPFPERTVFLTSAPLIGYIAHHRADVVDDAGQLP